MKSRRFLWKLFLPPAACLVVVLGGGVWYVAAHFERRIFQEVTHRLRTQATSLERALRGRFDTAHSEELRALARRLGVEDGADARVTFVLADGRVMGDSKADPDKMASHADRPEIRAALANGWAERIRWSHTVARKLYYVAVRVGTAREPAGVVRLAIPLDSFRGQTRSIRLIAVTAASLALVLGLALLFSFAWLWGRRMERVTNFARNLFHGDTPALAAMPGADALAMLGEVLRRTRDRLTCTADAMTRQRRSLYDLLDRLDEGLVITDPDGRVFLVNEAARRLLQIGQERTEQPLNRLPVEECVRQHELQAMLQPRTATTRRAESRISLPEAMKADRLSSSGPPEETRVEVMAPTGQMTILARGFDIELPEFSASAVTEDAQTRTGRLLVLSDVSELKHTVQMKADFAANASHELRTPLSAMRAAIETLRCIDLKADCGAAAEFLDVIDRHSDRMQALVSDLLDLSRVEAPSTTFTPAAVQVPQLLGELHETFAPLLAQKELQWEVTIEDGCDRCVANPDLLRMVLRNVIDNAIQFTDRGGHVRIAVYGENGAWCISIRDDGCGIPERDQPRIFERFYQVQRARTGSRRGTGLGLSIVRHAVMALGGQVSLESEVGVGTNVTLAIPQPVA